jgi:hypothetical protein
MNGPFLRFNPAPLLLLVVAGLFTSPAALSQNSAYGHWVNDPKNIATPGFVYDPPPAGFNPLTASDAELEQWGFPPRPSKTDKAGYARWKRTATLMRVTPQLTPTNIYNGPARNVRLGPSVKNAISTTSENWSGVVITDANGTFAANNSFVFADWNIPAVGQPIGICNSTWYYSSQWVGFDGFGTNDVLQAGDEADANCTSTSYSFWYEWYPNAETRISFPAAPGDPISVNVWYTTASPHGHATLTNWLTGNAAFIGFNPPSGTTYFGSSAEWIVERPTVNGSLADLSNYSSMGISLPEASNVTNQFYPSGAPAGATIYNVAMTCPPWNPSSSCTSTTTISYPYTTVYSPPYEMLYFQEFPPAGKEP